MGVTRFPFTPEHRRANALLTAWMEEAGLRVHMDDAGTLIGRYDAGKNTRTLLMGSHQDSVKHGGATTALWALYCLSLHCKHLSVGVFNCLTP
nr:hypothetical protein [Enterovibrio nigricans]